MEYTLLQAVQRIISGLSLVDWNSVPLPSAIRKLPEVDEEIDTLPLLCLVPKDEEPRRRVIAFGPVFRVEYPIELAFIAGGNHDFTSHLSTYTGWQTAVMNAFPTRDALKQLVPAVLDVSTRPGLVIDRQKVNDNYDYGGLTLQIATVE